MIYKMVIKLDSVTAEKDLGIWISDDLKASQQCMQAYSKANKLWES